MCGLCDLLPRGLEGEHGPAGASRACRKDVLFWLEDILQVSM